jgi:hypothetical protein
MTDEPGVDTVRPFTIDVEQAILGGGVLAAPDVAVGSGGAEWDLLAAGPQALFASVDCVR